MIASVAYSVWHLFWGWAGIDMLIGLAAVAVAILEPKQLDAITDLRKWAIVVAVIALTFTATLTYGYRNGLAVKQAEWDAALVKETHNGEAARTEAVRTVGPVSADRRMFRSDPRNRDRGKQPVSK